MIIREMNLTQLAYICALNETFDATVWIAVADTVARRSCWHPDYRINLRYRHVSHIHISVYYIYIYTHLYTYACIKILCVGDIGGRVHGYIYIYKWKGWRRKSGHAEIFFRAFPLQVGGCERTNYRTYTMMHVCKTLEDACYNYESVWRFYAQSFVVNFNA